MFVLVSCILEVLGPNKSAGIWIQPILGIPSSQDSQHGQYFQAVPDTVHLAEFVSLDFSS
jgi:hypothetical protein